MVNKQVSKQEKESKVTPIVSLTPRGHVSGISSKIFRMPIFKMRQETQTNNHAFHVAMWIGEKWPPATKDALLL